MTGNDPAPGDRPVMRVYRINGDGRVGRKLAWALKRQLLQGHTNPRERYLMVEDGRIKRFRGVTPYLEEERREIQEELTALFADVSGGLKSWAQGQATPMCAVGLNGGGGHPVSSAESVENGYGPTCAERVWHSWDDQPPDVWGGVKKPAKPRRR